MLYVDSVTYKPDLEPDDLRACLAYAHAVIARDKLDSVISQTRYETELQDAAIITVRGGRIRISKGPKQN